MSNMSNESEDRMVVNDFVNSPSTDEVTSGGNISGGGSLKKGPWTSAEDAILVEYVNKHGEGNWNAVQKHSGLSRCGKSCRLRWANHLRPDLKKGAFTPDEERHIIELHAKMGNKWARMASEFPGRTDNEIKNFWNTRIKRRQRAGLPIYPPDICLQSLDENSPSQNMGLFSSGETLNSELLLANNLEIPSVKFENYELNQHLHQSLLDIHGSNLLSGGPNCTCSNSFRFSTMHPAKRLRESEPSLLRESEPSLPGVTAVVSDVHTAAVNQYMDDSCLTTKSFGATRSHDLSSSQCLLSGSHAFTNGNSSSKPVPWAMKLELPSLQYSDTQMGRSWVTPSPLPSLESVDTLIQTPRRERAESACFSPQNNGLLESILYESRALKKSKKHSSQQTLDTCTGLENSAESLAQLHEADWDVYGDPNSPLGRSITSVFSDCAPPASGSLLDEQQLMKTLPVKQEVVDWDSATHNEGNDGNSCQINFSRPDYLLDSNWFGLGNEHGKDYFILRDAIGSLLTEDFSCELQVDS